MDVVILVLFQGDLEKNKKILSTRDEDLSTVSGECKRLELNVDEINVQMDEEKAKYHKQEQKMDKIKVFFLIF